MAVVSALMALPASAQECHATDLEIAFGEVGTGGANASGSVAVTCDRGLFNLVAIRVCTYVAAGGPTGGVNPRWMSNNNNGHMQYDLYSDAGRTAILGPSGSGFPTYSDTMNLSLLTFSRTINMQVWARAHPGQSLPATSPFSSDLEGQVHYAFNRGLFASPPPPTACVTGAGAEGFDTAPFNARISATFANICRITTATDLDFGAVTALADNRDQTSTISFQCPTGTPWRVGLDNGSHAIGDTRRMLGPNGSYLRYELYRDPERTRRWGSAIGTDTSDGTGTNATQSLTVHGRVPVQPSPVPGNYADTVTITLTY